MSGTYQNQPETVAISGTSQAIATLSQVETEPIDLTGLTKDHQFTAAIKLPPGISKCEPNKVKVRVHIVPVPAAENQ